MDKNPLAMSDEDLLREGDPIDEVKQEEPVETEEPKEETPVEEPEVKEEEPVTEEPTEETTDTVKEEVGSEDEGKEEPESEENNEPKEEGPKVDYQEFYKKIVDTPFKANKKEIKVKDAQEAIQLMQQGANYVQKMQQIAPYRKILIMLENNGLLDESKLSHLIDLDKKNPQAIAKLVKDAGIDPLDIDTAQADTYQNPNYSVSNEEVNFVSVLDELKSTEDGTKTLVEINSNWDKASKDALWNEPEIMRFINDQRRTGVYQMISEEVNRRRTLGSIPASMPFLAAYKQVGDELMAAKANNSREPIARKVSKPKTGYGSSERVRAAAPTRTSPKKASKVVNPLSLSDDDFFKQFEQNRY